MKIYLVGGAVRDRLLGLPIKEKDWVVVGATPEQMLALGFRQVGKDFPVFLNPYSNEEYALARKERKVSPGYTGFAFDTNPEVSLAEDLLRRDLTINAIAQTPQGELIDPYHGQKDLAARVLRHVSAAFTEDPVRILRIARFAARYAGLGFVIAPETSCLLKKMVHNGEVKNLVAERVWKELERSLSEAFPERFFTELEKCGALAQLFDGIELENLDVAALKYATTITQDKIVRFTILVHKLTNAELKLIAQRYRIPKDYMTLTQLIINHQHTMLNFSCLTAPEVIELFIKLDAFRRQERFQQFLIACSILAGLYQINFSSEKIMQYFHTTYEVDVQALLAKGFTGKELAEQIKLQRIKQFIEILQVNS